MRLETDRLLLRAWDLQADLDPMAAIFGDPVVREHFPGTLSRMETRAVLETCDERHARNGFSFLPLVRKSDDQVLGWIGLDRFSFAFPDTDDHSGVEIGWVLAKEHWGRGYVTEMGLALIKHARDVLGLNNIVSFTVPANLRSQAVMKRLGMKPWGGFAHSKLPADHPLSEHVRFRLDM